MVMIGNLFAFTYDSPGKLQSPNHHDSSDTLVSYSGSSALKSNYVEGVTITKQVSKSLNDVINQLREGIRSGCSYQNVDHVQKLQNDPEFVRVTRIK
jgi:IMP dehydrogenase/GMP reductase